MVTTEFTQFSVAKWNPKRVGDTSPYAMPRAAAGTCWGWYATDLMFSVYNVEVGIYLRIFYKVNQITLHHDMYSQIVGYSLFFTVKSFWKI